MRAGRPRYSQRGSPALFGAWFIELARHSTHVTHTVLGTYECGGPITALRNRITGAEVASADPPVALRRYRERRRCIGCLGQERNPNGDLRPFSQNRIDGEPPFQKGDALPNADKTQTAVPDLLRVESAP